MLDKVDNGWQPLTVFIAHLNKQSYNDNQRSFKCQISIRLLD